ncbi:MAG: glucosaminidase domain-containing protein [Lachnospiraceae bacterium]|nr:glucosaminidase domain-containing protein [Lachnospiraceae bacterium]
MTYSTTTEKKISDIHERMMSKDDFNGFSEGVSEDIHTKSSTIIREIRKSSGRLFKNHALITLMCIAIMLWTIIIGSIMTYMLQKDVGSLQMQVDILTTQNDTMSMMYQSELAEYEIQISSRDFMIEQLNEEITAAYDTIATLEAELAIPDPIIINYSDITHRSGLTAEQFDEVINTVLTKYKKGDTQLTGLGQALYDMETEYDINGFLALGISGIESGWGCSNLAVNSNNLYGLIGMSFDSTYDCTMYFGKLMRNHYIGEGRTSLASISKKYCEGNTKWVSDVSWFIGIYTDAAKELYSN